MRKKIIIYLLVCILCFKTTGSVSAIFAEDLDQLEQQEEQINNTVSELERTVDEKVLAVNTKQQHVSQLEEQISALEAQRQQTQAQLEEKRIEVAKRANEAEKRMQLLQTESSSTSLFSILIDAKDFSDVIMRYEAFQEFQQASIDQIEQARVTIKEVETLEKELTEQTNSLVLQKEELSQESARLSEELNSLQQLIADNREALDQIAQKRVAEQQRIADEIARQEALAAQLIQQQAPEQPAVTQPPAPVESSQPAPAPAPQQPVQPTPAPSNGREITVTATAYSYKQPGLSFFTATGLDLRVNPQVIAVDPRVIPLGSYVHIPGYGVYLAADTGGAIVGNKIDIHMTSVEACYQFGRRTLTVTVLN